MVQIRVLGKNVFDPMFADFGLEYLQHTRGRIGDDSVKKVFSHDKKYPFIGA